jgi:predicted RNA-binding protein with PIN domain
MSDVPVEVPAARVAHSGDRCDDVPDEVVRPALEFVVAAVARDARSGHGGPVPVGLRPFLRFRRLPAAALHAVRRVVDDDAELRAWVARDVDDGPDSVTSLYLRRPEGWLDALGARAATARAEATAAQEHRDERTARRRVATLEDVLARTADELAAARDTVAERDREITRLEQVADRAARDLDARDREIEVLRRRLAVAERARARAEQAQAEAERARAAVVTPVAPPAPPPAVAVPVEVPPPPPPSVDPLDRVGLGRALGAAAQATSALASALEAAREILDVAPTAAAVTPAEPSTPAASTEVVRPQRRTPLPVPRGLPEDSTPVAVEWLRARRLVLVVDGYNVAKDAWPSLALAVQRERLLDLLTELEARHGTRVEVVFDGADIGPTRPAGYRRVRVVFSPPGVTADEVIVGAVTTLDPAVPVAVATDDAAVREAVRRRGANVIGARQLLAAARR